MVMAMMRAHPETMAWSPRPRVQPAPVESRQVLIAVVGPDAEVCALASFERHVPQHTGDALRLIERERPGVVVVDFDLTAFDGAAIARAAALQPAASVLAVMSRPEMAPAALKAGSHAVLLKPFAPNLMAARLGRLVRERAQQIRLRGFAGAGRPAELGTNRVWPKTPCPRCAANGATSFEFFSHRRMWYACLGCEHVWLGKRQE